ncbi:Predicted nucleic acid-binding protein, contains Zn-ribbon domain [Pedobacter steynii]|uniref:Predicted nucleic acid-binding protein, contains Zn-ribbon domain n=1 Tax=Pedobacter steynii TaxID=430522 RepID=A0A1G9L1U8_9SPHI|nr:DUF2310 family Zn-ribbon-containing protein [Pedobacter steynii]NQX38695.1 DUF2310 family Zn-ribbon-containing protein [Pedobacter steynii]SDL55565.1 Predicted nucleic acid-binding protein, contains Zn-ribbon domain [Pedobacter steynii]
MYIQEIQVEIKSKADKDEIFEEMSFLTHYYRGNGQSQGRIESQYIAGSKIICLPFTLEKDSLDRKYNNFYTDRQREKIEQLCDTKIQIKTVGKTCETYNSACNCKKSDFYILITNYITIESPICCGTCHQSVPLYRLPKYADHGYAPILSWESNYISCDTLQMNCEVGERWASNQMEDLKSTLTKQGLKICRTLESLTHTPVYYYLHNYSKYKGDELSRTCPGCNSNWGLQAPLHDRYDFKCDQCRLVSTLSGFS